MSEPIFGRCEACGGEVPLVSGQKQTCRESSCSKCKRRYAYSCWVIGRRNGNTYYKIEMFPVQADGTLAAPKEG
jgi:hypothetical protein